ncbi:hypothetical protein RR46_14220 [Papilio xuthus]|uniref:Replicase polyprotein 1a n=2 Tax=Papilio xuthus TaxID=66420 RepID=A0A194PJU4_PAPXU|nr:hypothetical protein RR46_14220 [Papilio xuthus]
MHAGCSRSGDTIKQPSIRLNIRIYDISKIKIRQIRANPSEKNNRETGQVKRPPLYRIRSSAAIASRPVAQQDASGTYSAGAHKDSVKKSKGEVPCEDVSDRDRDSVVITYEMRSLLLLAVLCCLALSAWASPIGRPEDDKEVEDDDDDDDEPAAVQPVVAPADTVAAAPAAPAVVPAAAEEVSTLAEEAESAEGEAVAEGEELEAGQKEPASAEVESQASAEVAAPESDAEDDDDEEEDDITDALDPEDDDDDDEEEEDDDDEDDDITDALGRNISKHSRESKKLNAKFSGHMKKSGKKVNHTGALKEEPEKQPTVPAAYIVKYNRFVDNILEKMNDILRRSYDPVNVKLQPIDAKKKNSKPKKDKTKTKSKKKSSSKKKQTKRAGNTPVTENKVVEGLTKTNEINDAPLIESKIVDIVKKSEEQTETRVLKDKSVTPNGKAKPTTTRPKPPTKATKPKPKPPVKTTTKKPVNKNKTKTSEKSKPRAKGTLYGLSSLRRNGDVAVNILSDHTTVKSNFAVGPLVLRVEKEIGRGAKKEIKSATATTAEMTGKITLRVNNQGVATLHSIKVLQPKQVRVDSNHERTRELVWQRSARIAHVVSEKLMSASKPMFYH